MPYSNVDDMMLGDMVVTSDRSKFITSATEEIDAALGFVYQLPLTNLTGHVALLLKRISVHLSTGRYILARAIGGEDDGLHAYGESLLREGKSMLDAIKNGQVDLVGCAKIDTKQAEGNAPATVNYDATSGVDAFYKWAGATATEYEVMRQSNFIWRPGAG